MGRKAKKGLDYFSHDCNHDNELKYIEVLHKNGYKVFFKLLEHIYGVEGYYCKADKKNIAIFVSDKLKDVDIEEVNAIINDCLSEHLFDKCLHKKYEILTSASIQRRFFEAIKRRSELELINEYILKDNVDINELNVNINWLNVDKSTQSKVKESKVKESKVNIDFDLFWNLYDKKVGDKTKLATKWNKLKDDERYLIMLYIPKYIESQPDKQFRKHPATFLNNRSWEDEIIINTNGFDKSITKPKRDMQGRKVHNVI